MIDPHHRNIEFKYEGGYIYQKLLVSNRWQRVNRLHLTTKRIAILYQLTYLDKLKQPFYIKILVQLLEYLISSYRKPNPSQIINKKKKNETKKNKKFWKKVKYLYKK